MMSTHRCRPLPPTTRTDARPVRNISGRLRAVLTEGTLYPALLELEQMGWVGSKWGASEHNRRARYYSITLRGPEAASGRSEELVARRRDHGALPRPVESFAGD